MRWAFFGRHRHRGQRRPEDELEIRRHRGQINDTVLFSAPDGPEAEAGSCELEDGMVLGVRDGSTSGVEFDT